MKRPGSITLALRTMAAAAEVVIAACGVSDKYPLGKSEAMVRARARARHSCARRGLASPRFARASAAAACKTA
jgi:hypothetical protein